MDAPSQKPGEPRFQIRLLGPLEIQFEGEFMPLPRAKKAQVLLGYLLIRQGLPSSRANVAAMLWPDSHDEVARFNLRQLLSNLRKELGPLSMFLDTEGANGLTFRTEDVWLDVREFESSLQSDPARSVELVRGSLLDGLSAEWLDSERRRIESATLTAFERLADSSDGEERLRWLEKLVGADPFRESGQQKLISHLTQSGDLAGAARVYRQFEELLQRELNAVPSLETSRIFQQPITSTTPKTRTKLGNLPASLSSFIGREVEANHVIDQLDSGRLVTLTGTGGIGKTRLSLRVAEAMYDQFADGIWFIELAPVTDADLIPYVAAEVLRVRESPTKSILQAIKEALQDKELLLILDNGEHLLEGAARFAELALQCSAQLRVLATSRERLAISGEITYLLPSLLFPAVGENGSPTQLAEFESIRLFVERARSVNSRFRLDERNAGSVGSICRRLDGMPLAIELAASRVSSMTAEQIEERLDDCFRILTGGNRTALPRQQTLAGLIDWSYNLLTLKERTLFARLSVFAGSWSLEGAESVCASEGIEEEEILDLLTSLVERSLVVFGDTNSRSRYRLLETLRQFAQVRLSETGEVEMMRRRHRDFYIDVAERANPESREAQSKAGGTSSLWTVLVSRLEVLDIELENLRAALDWSLRIRDVPNSLRMCASLPWFWRGRGLASEGLGCCRRALALDGTESWPSELANALAGAGNLARDQADFGSAKAFLESSLAIREQMPDSKLLSWTHVNLGRLADAVGDLAGAREHYRRGLKLARLVGHKIAETRCLTGLAEVEITLGNAMAVKASLEENLAISRSIGDGFGVATILQLLGMICIDAGDYTTARDRLAESLELLVRAGERVYTTDAVESFGLLALRQGDLERAARLWGAADSLRIEAGTPMPPAHLDAHQKELESLRHRLGADAFRRSWAAGSSLTQDQVIDLALLSRNA